MLTDIQIANNKHEFLQILGSVKRDGIENLIEWLSNPDPKVCDFFIAPSSTSFHGNYKGGLCEHSLNVYKCLKQLLPMYEELTRAKGKEPVIYTDEQCIIAALLHDLCKIQYYREKEKFIKGDDNQWIKYMGYEINDAFPFGHGEKSVFLAQRFIMLTGVEALAIRWHMGFEKQSTGGDSEERKTLGNAWNIVPLAYLLHQADSMSAFLLEDQVDPKKNSF